MAILTLTIAQTNTILTGTCSLLRCCVKPVEEMQLSTFLYLIGNKH